jgi:hypothetical protein
MTITSVGYGDICATFGNNVEMATATALMLISSLIYAQVIGTYCGVVATLNPELMAFHETMDDLNRFMIREEMPNEMRRRLREYFHQSKHLRLAETQKGLLQLMPPSLKGEVSWQTNQEWLTKIWFLKDAPKPFMVQLAMNLRAMVYAPGDSPRIGFMYIVHRGVAIYRASVITKGKVFGEDMILSSPHLRSNAQAKAMNYLEVYYTSRRELLHIAHRYPKTYNKIRRAAVMLALRREIINMAKLTLGVSPGDKISAALSYLRKELAEEHGGTTDTTSPELSPVELRKLLKERGPVAIKAPGEDESLHDGKRSTKTDGRSTKASLFGLEATAEKNDDEGVPEEIMESDEDDFMPASGGMIPLGRPRAGVSPGGRHSPLHGVGGIAAAGAGFGGRLRFAADQALAASRITDAATMPQQLNSLNALHVEEMTRMKADIVREMDKRMLAQETLTRQSMEMAAAAVKGVDEVLKRLALLSPGSGKHRKHHIPGREEAMAQSPGMRTVTHCVNSVTSVTAEDRYQDGEREHRRDRPRRHRTHGGAGLLAALAANVSAATPAPVSTPDDQQLAA